MGARGKNVYNELVRRYGFAEAARRIQDLYLDGKKAETMAAERARRRGCRSSGHRSASTTDFALWRECGAKTLLVATWRWRRCARPLRRVAGL